MEKNNKKNGAAGQRVSAVGIVCNLILAAAKIAAGAIAGLVSVVADGINNLSDCGSSAVSLVSFRVAEKPADREHPYGHRRIEYVASMIIAFLVLALAVELLRESVETIASGAVSESVWWLYVVLGGSVLVKAGMFFFYRVGARRLDSDTLRAAATDSACDCIASLAVVLGMVLSTYTPWKADGYVGIAVALFILWQGACVLKEAGSKLLGQAPDEALVRRVREILLAGEGILGVHDLKIYGYGKGVTFATAHAEMDARLPALASHETLDGLERKVLAETGVSLTLHLDPVMLDDEEAKELESRVRAAVEGLAEGVNLHDFRLVRGAKNKVVFELGIPFDCPVKDSELKNDAERAVRIFGDYEPSVTVERE